MPANRPVSSAARATVARLAKPARVRELGPVAGRFVHALRLIALYERARRDPVPELATRLGSVEIAAKTLALAQAITSTWPENIHVSRFCCGMMSHDEMTIGLLVDSAAQHDRDRFGAAAEGLVRPDRIERLWEPALSLVATEMRCA